MYTVEDLVDDLAKGIKVGKLELRLESKHLWNIWKSFLHFVSTQLDHGKTVHVPGLGKFTWGLDAKGSHGQSVYRHPVFVLSETFVQTFNLQYKKPVFVPTQVPDIDLNSTVIAHLAQSNKETVSSTLKIMWQRVGEICQYGDHVVMDFDFAKLVCENRNIEVYFTSRGGFTSARSGKTGGSTNRPGTRGSRRSERSASSERSKVNTFNVHKGNTDFEGNRLSLALKGVGGGPPVDPGPGAESFRSTQKTSRSDYTSYTEDSRPRTSGSYSSYSSYSSYTGTGSYTNTQTSATLTEAMARSTINSHASSKSRRSQDTYRTRETARSRRLSEGSRATSRKSEKLLGDVKDIAAEAPRPVPPVYPVFLPETASGKDKKGKKMVGITDPAREKTMQDAFARYEANIRDRAAKQMRSIEYTEEQQKLTEATEELKRAERRRKKEELKKTLKQQMEEKKKREKQDKVDKSSSFFSDDMSVGTLLPSPTSHDRSKRTEDPEEVRRYLAEQIHRKKEKRRQEQLAERQQDKEVLYRLASELEQDRLKEQHKKQETKQNLHAAWSKQKHLKALEKVMG